MDYISALQINNIAVCFTSYGFIQILCILAFRLIISSSAFRDAPKKRNGAVSVPSGPGRSATNGCSLSSEAQPEEAVDENFPVS